MFVKKLLNIFGGNFIFCSVLQELKNTDWYNFAAYFLAS